MSTDTKEEPKVNTGGRKSVLHNPKTRKRIIDELVKRIEHGMPYAQAAAAVRITKRTFYRWKALGEEVATKLEEMDLDEPDDSFQEIEIAYWQFYHAIKVAETTCLDRNLLTIQVASENHWQAAAWWCERRFPQDFGRFTRIEHTGNEEKPVAVKTSDVTTEDVLRRLSPEDRRKLREVQKAMQLAQQAAAVETDQQDESDN